MSAPKRFLNGISSVSSADPLGALPYLDPTKWITYNEHFVGPLFDTATVNNTTVTQQGLTVVASTNATVSIVTDAGGLNGCLKIVTTAADNEHAQITTTSPGWVLTSGKKFIMETSFEITAATPAQNELFIGLASNQATTDFFAADGTARTFDDGIGWYSTDADADIDLICGENDVFINTTVKSTYATATWYKMSVYYDGATLYCYRDDALVSTLTATVIPVSVVGPAIYFKSGEAAVQSLLVDYLMIAKEV